MTKLIYLVITWSGHILREFLGSFYFLITKKIFKKCGESIFFTGIPYITGIDNIELGDNLVIRWEGGLLIGNNVIVATNLQYTYIIIIMNRHYSYQDLKIRNKYYKVKSLMFYVKKLLKWR